MNFIVTNFIFPRLHYLFYATLALMAGICCQFFNYSLEACLIAILLAVLGLFYIYYAKTIYPLLFIVAASIGIGSYLCYNQQKTARNFIAEFVKTPITLEGTVSSLEKIQHPRFSFLLTISTHRIKKNLLWKPCSQTIVLYLKNKPELIIDDYIVVENLVLKNPPENSYALYLAKEKIAATFFLETFTYALLKRPRYSLNRFLFNARNTLFSSLRKKINRETFQLFSSIFLGNRSAIKKEMDTTKESFKIWGTSHYLARSGLHLVIFVIIWQFILGLLPFSYIFKQASLLLLVGIYWLLSWSSISFARALLMVFIYKWCLFTKTPSHYVHLVILVTFLILLANPLQLFFLDFQLSFGLTLALAWFNHIEARKKQLFI